MINQWNIDDLVKELIRVPGLTVQRERLDPKLDQIVAERANRVVEYNRFGSPVFMPQDPEHAREIRAFWARLGGDT